MLFRSYLHVFREKSVKRRVFNVTFMHLHFKPLFMSDARGHQLQAAHFCREIKAVSLSVSHSVYSNAGSLQQKHALSCSVFSGQYFVQENIKKKKKNPG